jgi:c-di-GMP-binding flagellar brake protein YcgR
VPSALGFFSPPYRPALYSIIVRIWLFAIYLCRYAVFLLLFSCRCIQFFYCAEARAALHYVLWQLLGESSGLLRNSRWELCELRHIPRYGRGHVLPTKVLRTLALTRGIPVSAWWLNLADATASQGQALLRLERTTIWLALALIVVAAVRMLLKGLREAQKRAAQPKDTTYEVVSPELLKEGWQATIQVPAESGLLSLPARIAAIERRWMTLSLLDRNVPASLRAGTPALVTVTGETAAFRFHAGIRDGRPPTNDGTLLVQRPVWLEKIQRRANFRVPVSLPAVLSLPEGQDGEFKVYQACVSDFSAGGFRAAMSAELKAGDHARLRISDAALSGFSFDARVIHCEPTRLSASARFLVHCEFLYVTDDLRDRLVAYCFDLQRAARRAR